MSRGHPYRWRGRYPNKIRKRSGGNILYGVANHRYNGRPYFIIKNSHDVVLSLSDENVWRVAEDKGLLDEDRKLTKKAYIQAGKIAIHAGPGGMGVPGAVLASINDAAIESALGILWEVSQA